MTGYHTETREVQSFKHFVLRGPTRCRLFSDTVSIAVIIYCRVVTECFREPERTGIKLLQFKTLIPALTWKGLVKSQKTFSQGSRVSHPRFKPGTSKYERELYQLNQFTLCLCSLQCTKYIYNAVSFSQIWQNNYKLIRKTARSA
jgi:hypothetical protein